MSGMPAVVNSDGLRVFAAIIGKRGMKFSSYKFFLYKPWLKMAEKI